MTDPTEPIVLVHKDLPDAEYICVNEDQAEALAASGWKRKPTPKATAAKNEEKS